MGIQFVTPTEMGAGIFAGADPDNQIKQIQIAAAGSFKDGIPTDAAGNPDFAAMAKTLYQKGDFANAANLAQTGISQQLMRAAQAPSAVLGGGGGQPPANPQATSSGAGANPDVVSYIRQRASDFGINPNVALAVASSEGLRGFDPNGKPNLGDAGSSAGPFQLHYGGVAGGPNASSGLGDAFTKATGLDARDPSTWKAQIDFALSSAAKGGWGPWHGAARAGIGEWTGIGNAPSGSPAAPQPSASAASPPAAPVQVAQNGDSDAPSSTHPYAASATRGPAASPPPAAATAGTAGPAAASSSAPPPPPLPNTPYASNGSNFVDPTLGGLVTPEQLQRYGSYGGVAKAAAAEAASLSNNPYAKERATVLLDYAKQIMSTVAKAQELTSEQKNARDPLVIQQQTDLATTRARARADAMAENSLVPVALPDGTMTLMPKKVALAQAAAGNGPVQSLPGYVTTGQANLQKKLDDGSAAYAERQVAEERLDAISNLLSTYQTGANSQAFNDAAAKLRSFGIDVPNSDKINPAAVQQVAKNAYANVLSAMKEQGNKQFVSEVQSAVNSNPNTDLQPEANAAMVAQMQGIKKYHDQNFQDYTNWLKINKGASNDAQFQIDWAKANPLATYISAARREIAPRGVPVPAPDQRAVGQRYSIPGKGVFRWMGNGWSAQ